MDIFVRIPYLKKNLPYYDSQDNLKLAVRFSDTSLADVWTVIFIGTSSSYFFDIIQKEKE